MAKSRRRHRPKTTSANGRVTPETRAALAMAETAVARAAEEVYSQQPRLHPGANPEGFFSSLYQWLIYADLQPRPYQPDSRARDEWLRHFWQLESYWGGVLNSTVALDKNRGWSITGGRNQVYRLTDILHRGQVAPGLRGWRSFVSAQALSYYVTDMGTVTECGRDGQAGPLRALYHVDSARCALTGRPEAPLRYYPATAVPGARGGPQLWPEDSFFRTVSMPSDDEKFHGLGYCATSRALELARLMVAIFRKDQEMLGAAMPEGLLLLQGIQQSQWEAAMADRDAQLAEKERRYFGGVFVLATAGIEQVDAKLIALRQLPENFSLKTFVDMMMYAYALTVGYSPREFWPVSSGALGTATEAETQDDNSTGKGESDFILGFQEQLNEELPESVLFEFDSRDAKGDLEVVAVQQAKVNLLDGLSKLEAEGRPLLSAERIAQLAAQEGLVPEDWVAAAEQVEATDTSEAEVEQMRQKLRRHPRVQRARARFPREPIIRAHWPTGREVVLFDPGAEPKRLHRGADISAGLAGADDLVAALDEALERLETRWPAAPGAAAPLILVRGADGTLSTLDQTQPEPPVVNVSSVVDLAPVAAALERALARSQEMTPAPISAEAVAGAVSAAVAPLLERLPRIDPAEIARVVARAVARQQVTAETLIPALSEALASALAALPAPTVENHVEVVVPTRARFDIQYDSNGRPISVNRQPT